MSKRPPNDEMLAEVFDRMRRVETRLTRYLEAQGMDTKVRTPFWEAGIVRLPSMATSYEEILAVVPKNWDNQERILLLFQNKVVGTLYI